MTAALSSRQRKRVAVVTGTRAEYGLLRSVMTALCAQPRIEMQLVATGMHLLRKFGHTVDDIKRDGWHIDARVRMQAGDDSAIDQAEGLARGVRGMARFFQSADTDIVVVLGDRIEAMAGALAAVTTGRVVAHIHGGDVATGDFDDALRHAITKLAHLHFTATRDSTRRVIRLGEARSRVFQVGAPGLDRMRELLNGHRRRKRRSHLAIVAQHAFGRPAKTEERAATQVLRAVGDAGLRRLILCPNSDRGHTGVLRAIERHKRAANPGDVRVVTSLPRDDFLRELLSADVLVGNSSAGIIEAPFAGTPSINVGPRQAGRQPGGKSVLQAAESYASVRQALALALNRRRTRGRRGVYGDGTAGPRIAQILADTRLTRALAQKRITY